jgi:HK97 family phage major capsid protein
MVDISTLKAIQANERRALAESRQQAAARRLAEDHVETLKRSLGEARAEAAAAVKASVQVTREPRAYERGNGHSYLCDQVAVALRRGDADGGVKAAEQRLARHDTEVAIDLPARLEARTRIARYATEAAATASIAELRAFERFSVEGGNIFKAALHTRQAELRALTRTDGQGGYTFVPPLWLTEDYIPYALAGRPFANLWHNLPLPPGTDEINLPRITLGPATGTQADAGPAPIRDLQDSSAQGIVRTIAGITDLPLIWLDQRPGDVDALLMPLLLEDYNTQIDGLCLLGSSAYAQLNGIMPAGALGAAQMISLQNTNNTASQQWAYGGASIAGSLHYTSAQLLSKIATARALNPTAWVVHPMTWAVICAAADQQARPLVPPGVRDPDATPDLHGLPVITDAGVPVTFSSTAGGPANPYIGAVTAGQVAATPGTGTYTPVLCGRWADSWLWEGEYKLDVFREVGSGNLTARVRLSNYVAAIANRFVWGGTSQTFSGTNQGGGVNAGGAVSYGALSQMVTNSVLQSGTGF